MKFITMYNILHITDLHLEDPGGANPSEHLRKGFYQEYLRSLCNEIKANSLVINCIVITGDFVHKFDADIQATKNKSNYDHALEIAKFLCNELGLTTKNVGVCIGNHDYSRKLDQIPTGKRYARVDYYNFADNFANKDYIYRFTYEDEERARLCKLTEDIYFLSVDATINSKNDPPGSLRVDELDEIAKVLNDDNFLPKGKLLVIGVHYSVQRFPGEVLFEETDDSYWFDGSKLRDRISSISSSEHTLWLFGDSHRPNEISENLQHFVMTGRLGLSSKAHPSAFPREASVVNIEIGREYALSYKFTCPVSTHGDNHYEAKWTLQGGKGIPIRMVKQPLPESKKEALLDINHNNNVESGLFVPTVEKSPAIIVELISETIQSRILEKVQREKLYKFGRFVTSKNLVSLGWVSINRIFESSVLLPVIVERSVEWMQKKLDINFSCENSLSKHGENILLIGVDFWGTIICSHISARTGIVNLCTATRAKGNHHTTYEFLNSSRLQEIGANSIKHVVVVTDVISSGRTITLLWEDLLRHFGEIGIKDVKISVISIFNDPTNKEQEAMNFVANIGTFCKDLKFPIRKKEELPPEDILSPSIDFTFS